MKKIRYKADFLIKLVGPYKDLFDNNTLVIRHDYRDGHGGNDQHTIIIRFSDKKPGFVEVEYDHRCMKNGIKRTYFPLFDPDFEEKVLKRVTELMDYKDSICQERKEV